MPKSNIEIKVCTKCHRELLATGEYFPKRSDSKDGLRNECKDCRHDMQIKYYANNHDRLKAMANDRYNKLSDELKLKVMNCYGGECAVCCHEVNIDLLTIDHINGGGGKHMAELGLDGHVFYVWLRKNKFPSGYRTLCFNCNLGRSVNGGICPHQIKEVKMIVNDSDDVIVIDDDGEYEDLLHEVSQ